MSYIAWKMNKQFHYQWAFHSFMYCCVAPSLWQTSYFLTSLQFPALCCVLILPPPLPPLPLSLFLSLIFQTATINMCTQIFQADSGSSVGSHTEEERPPLKRDFLVLSLGPTVWRPLTPCTTATTPRPRSDGIKLYCRSRCTRGCLQSIAVVVFHQKWQIVSTGQMFHCSQCTAVHSFIGD